MDNGRQVLLNSLFSIGDLVEVVNGGSKLRSKHCINDTNCKAIEIMSEGTPLEIIDGPIREDGFTWWYVQKRTDVVFGWGAEAVNDAPKKLNGGKYKLSLPALGKHVKLGDILGQVYNYGCARSGAHLHFAVSKVDNKYGFLPLDDTGIVRMNDEVIFTGEEIEKGRITYGAMPRE